MVSTGESPVVVAAVKIVTFANNYASDNCQHLETTTRALAAVHDTRRNIADGAKLQQRMHQVVSRHKIRHVQIQPKLVPQLSQRGTVSNLF